MGSLPRGQFDLSSLSWWLARSSPPVAAKFSVCPLDTIYPTRQSANRAYRGFCSEMGAFFRAQSRGCLGIRIVPHCFPPPPPSRSCEHLISSNWPCLSNRRRATGLIPRLLTRRRMPFRRCDRIRCKDCTLTTCAWTSSNAGDDEYDHDRGRQFFGFRRSNAIATRETISRYFI